MKNIFHKYFFCTFTALCFALESGAPLTQPLCDVWNRKSPSSVGLVFPVMSDGSGPLAERLCLLHWAGCPPPSGSRGLAVWPSVLHCLLPLDRLLPPWWLWQNNPWCHNSFSSSLLTQDVSGVLAPLTSHTNFRTVLSIIFVVVVEILIGILLIGLERVDVFTIVRCPIRKRNVSLRLFKSLSSLVSIF